MVPNESSRKNEISSDTNTANILNRYLIQISDETIGILSEAVVLIGVSRRIAESTLQ